MSIRAIHIFLISCAILLSVVFGLWLFVQANDNGSSVYQTSGIISISVAFGLCFYAVNFIKKTKALR